MKELLKYGEDRFVENSREGWQKVESVGLEKGLLVFIK